MNRFADPRVCPDCRSDLPPDPDHCPTCGLPLRNATAAELFTTLQHADALLEKMRSLPAAPLAARSSISLTSDLPAYPAPAATTAPDARRRGLSGASVPSILLGLGALCLLAASVIFLAVAWSWLGVGGRTAVLVALTVTAAGAGIWWSRRGLRVAGESLTVVALGLLTLDLFGARNAGWLGAPSDAAFALMVGFSLAVAGVALTVAARKDATSLAGPQLISAAGVLTAYAGLHQTASTDLWVSGISVGAVALLALAARGRLDVLAWSLLGVTVIIWLHHAGSALNAVPTPITAADLWSGTGWALLAAAAYLAAPALLPELRSRAQWWVGAAAVLATFTITLPAFDASTDTLMITALAALAAWIVAAYVLPPDWTWAARLPAIVAGLCSSVGLTVLVAESVARLGSPAPPYSATIGASLNATDTTLSPWFLAPTAVLLTVLTLLIAAQWITLTPTRVAACVAAVAAVGGALTLSLFAVPIWTLTAALTVIATSWVLLAATREDRTALPLAVASGPLFVAALVVARPSASLLAIAASALGAAAVWAALRGRTTPVALAGHLSAPVGVAIALYAAGEAVDLSETYRAVAVLLVLGIAAIIRARPDLEISAAVNGAVISAVAVFGFEGGPGPLALLLTLAGALITISALLNADRRLLGWVGGALLAAATWVRLADIGVGTPEAYTLPSALALVAVGLWRLQRNPKSETAPALIPGLVLATLPSLLWTLADPTSVRAVALGVACLALVLAGTALRWNAPLVVGAAGGAALVLIEVAPYAVQTPQWVLIGLAGAVLTTVGVTWESRMQDLSRAGSYLGRLR